MPLQSCLDLKNYEAVFALMEGLESKSVQQAEGSWQVNSDNYFYSTITYCPYSYSVHTESVSLNGSNVSNFSDGNGPLAGDV